MVWTFCCHHTTILLKRHFVNISFNSKLWQNFIITWVILDISIRKHSSNFASITSIISLVITLIGVIGIVM